MFLFPALTIGFLFVGVPLLVHLINMLRHRRQPWAAMDFLLASYRKQRKWIVLRQLLLLLARTAVAAVLIAMLCGWVSGGRWLSAMGGATTHHVIVLDDSYSMADVSGGATAYSRALAAAESLARGLATSDSSHQLTVLRSSRAALVVRGGSQAGDAAADLAVQTVTGDDRQIARVMATDASSLSADVVDALRLAGEMVSNTDADQTLVYLISDFRQRDWESPERLGESLRELSAAGCQIRCIDCAAPPAANLGITRLSPLPDVWVAEVPVVMEVAVKNYAATPASNINLSGRVIRYGTSATAPDPTRQYSGTVEPLPGLVIDRLEPGQEAVRQFQVFITETGTHAVEMALPEDALATDNRRSCTLPLADAQRVLIIDGDASQRGAYHIESVLDPGSQVHTGAIPHVRSPTFLRSATAEDLQSYRAIYLVGLTDLTDTAAAALQQYVASGGGLAWFLGSETPIEQMNRLLLDEQRNLLPGALHGPVELARPDGAAGSDLVLAAPHTLTEPLVPLGDSVLGLVGVSRSLGIDTDDPRYTLPSPPRRVLNRRDGLPFVLEHAIDQGRVITVLSGLDGQWTNWQGDPTFVVFLLRANAFLWSAAAPATSHPVDQPIALVLPRDRYAATVTMLPAVDDPPRVPIEWQATSEDDGQAARLTISPRDAAVSGSNDVDALLAPGVSEFWLTQLDGRPEVRASASTVRPGEGDLRRAERAEMLRDAQPAELTFFDAGDVIDQSQSASGGITTVLLLALLGVLLVGEQGLAYLASYHTPGSGGKG